MTSNSFVSTFEDSKVFGGIYFYSYALIVIAILFGAFYFATKVKLFHESHKFIQDVEECIGKSTIALRELKNDYRKSLMVNNNNNNFDFETQSNATKILIHKMFDTIRAMLTKHETYLVNKIESMKQKVEKEVNNKQQQPQTNKPNLNYNNDVDKLTDILAIGLTESKDNEDNSDTITAKVEQIEEIVNEKYKKYHVSLSSKQGCLIFGQILYKIRGLLIPALTHFFDTASDIALIWEFYILWKLDDNSQFKQKYNDIDMFSLFISSLCVMIYYRISSAFEVWQFTKNANESILQFLFDFFLIKLIYINIFKMKSYQASQVIKQFRMIEGGNESAFQAIITFVFLLKTNFTSSYSDGTSVAIISLIASLLSLISRLSILDKNCLVEKAREIKGFEIGHLFTNPKETFKNIDKQFIFHRFFRCIEILFSIFLIALFWHIVGGIWLLFLFLIGIINIYQQYCRSGQIQTDWFNYILVINITEVGHYFQSRFEWNQMYWYEYLCDGITYLRNMAIRLRLFVVRTAMVIVICCSIFDSGYNDHDVSGTDIVFVVLMSILFVLTCGMCLIVIKYLTIESLYENSTVENFRVFDYIANDNQDCVWFCKYLKCDIFYQMKRVVIDHDHDDNCCKITMIKPNIGEFYEPSNVVEAIVRSNNENYFDMISHWYDELNNNDSGNDRFYSYAHKEIELDSKLAWFIEDSCQNCKVFEHFICNDAYFIDNEKEESILCIANMMKKSCKFESKQALTHLIQKFASITAKFDTITINAIWDPFIDLDNGS